ncbi:MAG: AAA family ATPase [Desulfobacteraceae bacterium]|nr:MAG: AAA family ATPase [Desulfobacteraceae bacterium]
MHLEPTYVPEYESLKELLIDMASERSVPVVLDMIADRMALRPHIALVRIWLKKTGDICDQCEMISHCPERDQCLHLVAGNGRPISGGNGEGNERDWSDINGFARRIPLGYSGIGKIAVSGRPLKSHEVAADPMWQDREIWARGEHIKGFGAQPIRFKEETLGVIAIYTRIESNRVEEGTFWVRMISHHTALALANARAFNEIDHLRSQLELENEYLRQEINQVQSFGDIIGNSPPLMTILNQIELVAPTDASVLILGESGTGKELVAREIHNRSLRRERPMIRVNCATIPSDLYESEFFGHIKGAFTGALRNRAGRFQAADTGTLFLDEVGELPLSLQGKLLRVLQEGTYERIGEDMTRQVDVRIIAATNRDIRQDIERGLFRKDLYYRLNVFPIEIPPLRDRKEDIQPLVFHFLEQVLSSLKQPPKGISGADMNRLINYEWPGNVRELRNVIERSVITAAQGMLTFDFFEKDSVQDKEEKPGPSAVPNTRGKDKECLPAVMTETQVRELIRENIINALKHADGRIYGSHGAARLLGVSPTTLGSRMKKMSIDPQPFKINPYKPTTDPL